MDPLTIIIRDPVFPGRGRLSRAIALVAVVACARSADRGADSAPSATVAGGGSGWVQPADFLVDSGGVGRVRLGMTLDSARRALPRATFTRETDGDGAILVGVSFGKDTTLVLYAGEDSESIDWTRRIERIETFSRPFHTVAGVHVEDLVTDVEKTIGPVTEIILSEIESRQFVTFARQPPWLNFRLDYTGEFAEGQRRTVKFAPKAKIFSIAVSK